jgi:hypothetical protein
VFGVTSTKEQLKARAIGTSIPTVILFCLFIVAKLPKQKNKAKTLFQYV